VRQESNLLMPMGGPAGVGNLVPTTSIGFGGGALLTSPTGDRRYQQMSLEPIIQAPPYQPPPEIPDIEMIFAATPEMSRLRSFVLPLGMHKVGRCRLTLFKLESRARLVSTLETKMC